MEETDILPQRNRKPAIFAVLYQHPENGGLCVEECPSKQEAKKFIASLPDAKFVTRIYKVTDIIALKQRIVYSL